MFAWADGLVSELFSKPGLQLCLRLFDSAVIWWIMNRAIERQDEVIGEDLIDRRMIEVPAVVALEQ